MSRARARTDVKTTLVRWLKQPFVQLHLAACLLLLVWIFPPFRAWWDWLDQQFFLLVNRHLLHSSFARHFWTIANHRVADFASAICMALLFLAWILSDGYGTARKRLPFFAYVIAWILAAVVVTKLGGKALHHLFGFQRLSPTLVLHDVVKLSEHVTWAPVKDSSHMSFPGDHATILWVWAGSLWCCGGWRYGLGASAYAVLLTLPRLVVGAHWLSDNLVGSSSLALILLAWAWHSRLPQWALKFRTA